MSEFGRTPKINLYYGRDHWAHAWSVVVAGGKIQRGIAYRQDQRQRHRSGRRPGRSPTLFHTYLQAVGVDSTDTFEIEGRDVPIADPASKLIRPILT